MAILRITLSKLISIMVTLFGAAVVVFFVIRVVPGDPIAMMLPPGAREADIELLKSHYGFDKSIPMQFFIWLQGVLHGDFGESISRRQPVLNLVLGRLPATLELSIFALVLAVGIGFTNAFLGTRFRSSKLETVIDVESSIALSVPDFLWGLLLILLFGVVWPVFYISGRVSPNLDFDFQTNFYMIEALLRFRFDVWWDLVLHSFLPALALAIPLSAIISQLLKMSLKDTMNLDYVTLARTKGYSESQVIRKEAWRNAALPTITLIGVQFVFLIGGTVIIERLFSYEGLGNLAIDAVINRDLPLIQGIVIVFAVLFAVINLLFEVIYTMLNPRLRHG